MHPSKHCRIHKSPNGHPFRQIATHLTPIYCPECFTPSPSQCRDDHLKPPWVPWSEWAAVRISFLFFAAKSRTWSTRLVVCRVPIATPPYSASQYRVSSSNRLSPADIRSTMSWWERGGYCTGISCSFRSHPATTLINNGQHQGGRSTGPNIGGRSTG